MGWLPSAPQLETNPLEVSKLAAASGLDAKDYVAKALKSGDLKLSCDDPDNPKNWPRNMFIWRSNLLGASGKASLPYRLRMVVRIAPIASTERDVESVRM